jgi:SAM-dependent methyltransferase
VAEWKLFDREPPEPEAELRTRGRMHLTGQPGFGQRTAMVVNLARLVCALRPVSSITDLGCGDGSLLAQLGPCGVRAWGYDLGADDVAYGRSLGLDLRVGDITGPGLEYGDLLIATEVAEHLADPAAFIRGLRGRLLILSSPSLETGTWHNPIHAWAWDLEGYRDLVEAAGWRAAYQAECDGGMNIFGGVMASQKFQAILAVR